MKNKFLFSAFLMASLLVFANNTKTTSKDSTGSEQEKTSETCDVRFCKKVEIPVDGGSIEFRRCSDWISVPCDGGGSTPAEPVKVA